MYPDYNIQQDSPAWLFFVKTSFFLSVAAMIAGICMLPVDMWIKGYLLMGILFCTGSTITLCKTLRDNHEAQKLIHKLSNAKTEKILKEFEIQNP